MSWTVLVTAVVAATVGAFAVAAVGGVLAAELAAQDAADAAALAAAHATRQAASPAAVAASTAAAHGATLVICDCRGPVVTVEVVAPVATRAGRLTGLTQRTATASARLVRGSSMARERSAGAAYARRTITRWRSTPADVDRWTT